MNHFVSSPSVFLPQKQQYDHFSVRQFPFFCHLLFSISLCLSLSVSVSVRIIRLSAVFLVLIASRLCTPPPPAQSLGFSKGIHLSLPAAAGTFRSTGSSLHQEQCLQHSGNITISHFKNCHSVSSFHFLIGDRSILESLRCKVSSSYRSATHMLQARNNS